MALRVSKHGAHLRNRFISKAALRIDLFLGTFTTETQLLSLVLEPVKPRFFLTQSELRISSQFPCFGWNADRFRNKHFKYRHSVRIRESWLDS